MKTEHRKKLVKACVEIVRDLAVRQSLRAHLRCYLWGKYSDGSIIPERDRLYNYRKVMEFFEGALRSKDRDLIEFLGRNVPQEHEEPPKTPQRLEMAAYILRCLVGDDYRGFVGEEISDLSEDESAIHVWAGLQNWKCPDGEPSLPKKAEVRKKLNLSARRVEQFYQELAEASELDLDERRVKTNVWS